MGLTKPIDIYIKFLRKEKYKSLSKRYYTRRKRVKYKLSKIIIAVLLVFVLSGENSHRVFAEETVCEKHEFGSFQTVEKPTIYKKGKRIQACINCHYYNEYEIPKLPKILSMHEGQLFIKPQTTKVINFRYMSRGDKIKKIYCIDNHKVLKILSYDNKKMKIRTGKKNYLTVIVAETKSGLRDEFYVQIGNPLKNQNPHHASRGSGKISKIVKTKNVSASNSFYKKIKSRAYQYKNEKLSFDSGIRTIEIQTINDKNKKYYAAKIRKKKQKGILYINEYYYKKLYKFDYKKLKFTAANLDFTNKKEQIFTGCALSIAPRIYNGDVNAYYAYNENNYNRIFPEQERYFKKVFDTCSYKYKWKYDGHLIMVKNDDSLSQPYKIQYHYGYHYIIITIKRDSFRESDFTEKDMSRILKNWVKKYSKDCTHRFLMPCDSFIED